MLNERLVYLMERYVQQQLTEAEMAEFRLMLGNGQYEDQVKAVIDRYNAQGVPVYKMREGASTEILETVLQAAPPVAGPVVRHIRPYRYMWWAAAAVVLCGAGFYLWQRPATQPVAVKIISQPGAPGSNKAILTLADGAEVALDNNGDQEIQQGNTAIRQKQGLLQYDGSGKPTTVSYNVLYVPRGGQFQLVLPDGTKVWLNAASRLKYPTAFSGGSRVVELQGEAYFEVAKRADQPFNVKVNSKEIVEVLGTGFNIMSYSDEEKSVTTLVTGAIRVVSGEVKKVLQPGQQTVLDNHTGAMTVVPANVDKALAWKTGFFELDNTDLPTLMRQLSRWYDVEIIDQSGENTVDAFGGRISRTLNLRDVLHVLEQYGVRSRMEGNKVIILSK